MRTMKMIMTIIGLVVCGSLTAEEVTKEQGQDLLKKAGQEVLSRYEKRLEEKKTEIDNYIIEISSDGVVSRKGMLGLLEKVNSFDELKEEANKHLKIYGLTVNIELSKEVKEIVDEYFLYLLRYRDKYGNVRKLFAQITGQDLRIESCFFWKGFLVIIGLFILGVIGFIVGVKTDIKTICVLGVLLAGLSLLLVISGLLGQ